MSGTDVHAFLTGPVVHAAVGASAGTNGSVLAPNAEAQAQLATLHARATAHATAALDATTAACAHADEAAAGELVERINQHVHRGEYGEAVLLVSELVVASRFRLLTEEVAAGSHTSASAQLPSAATGAAAGGPATMKHAWWGVQGSPNGPPPGVSPTQLEKLQRSMDKVMEHYTAALASAPAASSACGERHVTLAALLTVLPPQVVWPLYVWRRRRDLSALGSLAPRSLASLRRLGAAVVECARTDACMLTGTGAAGRDGLTFADVASLPVLLDQLLLGIYRRAAM